MHARRLTPARRRLDPRCLVAFVRERESTCSPKQLVALARRIASDRSAGVMASSIISRDAAASTTPDKWRRTGDDFDADRRAIDRDLDRSRHRHYSASTPSELASFTARWKAKSASPVSRRHVDRTDLYLREPIHAVRGATCRRFSQVRRNTPGDRPTGTCAGREWRLRVVNERSIFSSAANLSDRYRHV
jgi:hypothetical protein